MIFSSYRFIFVFLPIVLGGYHLLRMWGRIVPMKLWLVAASLVFYGLGQPDFILGFIVLGLGNYVLAACIHRTSSQPLRIVWLLLVILWNLGSLFYFKYFNFFLEGLNLFTGNSFSMRSIILPLGISFFTFQMLAYVVSVYRGTAPLATLLDYSVFITFFPQLIVGPVVKQEEMLPQLTAERLCNFDSINVYRGVMLFSVGCAKKVLLANPLIDFATGFYGGDVALATMAETWFGVLAYTFAYYYDFSGYIDMARGIGHLFGITLPINFDSPYRTRNFADFWRAWNITISRFFSESIFNNLFHFGDGIIRLIFATLATFLVSGLWHGADWHYLVWGLANGILVCIANIMTLYRKSLPKAPAVALTFFFSVLIRVLFDCTGMTQAVQIYRNMFDLIPLQQFAAELFAFIAANRYMVLIMLISAVICFCCKNSNEISKRTDFTAKHAVGSAVLLVLSISFMSQVSGFLYFNF